MNQPTKSRTAPLGPLVVASNLPALRRPDGRVVLTQKFVEGMGTYAALWNGPVRAVLKPAAVETNNLDNKAYADADLPFEVVVEEFGGEAFYNSLKDAAVVLGGPDLAAPKISQRCRDMDVPCVNNFEHSLWTRLQINGTNLSGPVRKFRNLVWELGWERQNIASVRAAAGIQCNGTPAYDAYAKHSASPMLYFDSRTQQDDVISQDDLDERLQYLDAGNPLRLAFSGRLIPIKGALDLVNIADHLHRGGVHFEFDVYGDGESRPEMERRIDRYGLRNKFKLHGAVDFQTELIPSIKKSVDLFICCHRQGDPSCTYVETFACGVPILGYNNDALQGLIERAPVGWTTSMGKMEALASRIVALGRNRNEIMITANAARRFALENNFNREFEARIDHLASLAKKP